MEEEAFLYSGLIPTLLKCNNVSWLYFRQTSTMCLVNGCTSDKLVITHGVPQGSVLGPLLFLIFINDLPSMSECLTFYLFADNTNIYFESSELSKIEKVVNRELRKVRKWLEANRLALNVDKTNFVIFHTQQRKLTDYIVLKLEIKRSNRNHMLNFLECY